MLPAWARSIVLRFWDGPMITVEEARDLMLGHAVASVPVSYTMVFRDVPPSLLTGSQPWARATVKHAGGGQQGFGDGKRKFVRFGTLAVEIFTPRGDGNTEADTIAQGVLVHLEGVRSSQVWYRNIRLADSGADGAFDKASVYADFEYEYHH